MLTSERPPEGAGPRASIIIPTTARRGELERAIRSVLAQTVPSLPIVVVNGPAPDPAILAALRQRSDLLLLECKEHGAAAARHLGRTAVKTPFFGFLDDDDELFPDSVEAMHKVLEAGADAVVCNAWNDREGERTIFFPEMLQTGADLEAAMLDKNWLCLGAVHYKSEAAPAAQFDNLPFHCHVTLMALRAARSLSIEFLDKPVMIRYLGTFEQATRSERYLRTVPLAVHQAAMEATRRDIRAGLLRKCAAAWHELSDYYRKRGEVGKAWAAHLQSLRQGGLRFLPSTVHLVRATLARAVTGNPSDPGRAQGATHASSNTPSSGS